MPVPKGTRIGGRQKGTPNKTTASVKAAIEGAYAHLQSASNREKRRDFHSWAEDNPGDFYKLILPKIIPAQVMHSGNPDVDEPINMVERAIRKA